MKLSVSETAKLTGISVRTLHYYDEIHLLKPSDITEAGYRFYNEQSLAVLQQILLYRELDFPLKEIKDILSMPDHDRRYALAVHKELLLLKQKRIGKLIELVDETMRGDQDMSFKEFDMSEIEAAKEAYANEVKMRWGKTDAYSEYGERTKGYDKTQWKIITEEAQAIQKSFADCVSDGEMPDSGRARELVKQWKEHISRYYYNCTDEILNGLGQMYVLDGRFMEHLDQAGTGTAAFMSQAITCYCS